MAIAYDNSTENFSSGNPTQTTSLTLGTLTNGMVVCWVRGGNSDDITGVTFNGVSMILAAKTNGGGSVRYTYLFYLATGSTSGAHDFVISSNDSDAIYSQMASYQGVKQTLSLDSSAINFGTTSALTLTTSTVSTNTWTIAGFLIPTAISHLVQTA